MSKQSISIEKILKELDKGNPVEQAEAYAHIKDHITKNILKAQKDREEEANRLQEMADEISPIQAKG